MGRIIYILKKREIPKPELNNRFTVEMCENIHVHYRNFRFEFTQDEFLHILRLVRTLDEDKIKAFKYSEYLFEPLIEDYGLPDETFFDKRLQIERQKEGHYHLHYRNCRIELKKLRELGFGRRFGLLQKWKYKLGRARVKWSKRLVKLFWRIRPADRLESLPGVALPAGWTSGRHYRRAVLKSVPLRDIKCVLYCKEGTHIYSIDASPAYLFLKGDEKAYDDYFDFLKLRQIDYCETHSKEKFRRFLEEVERDGYDERNVLIVDEENHLIDGLHRAALLQHRYGQDYQAKTLKIYGLQDRQNK